MRTYYCNEINESKIDTEVVLDEETEAEEAHRLLDEENVDDDSSENLQPF